VLIISEGLSTLFTIVIALIAVSIVIGVIFFGLSQSRDVAALGYEQVIASENISAHEVIQTFNKWQERGMPAASCYTLLKSNPNLVRSLLCAICGGTTIGIEVGDCIKNHIHGRVSLLLTEDEGGGTYTAVLIRV
jgi:hypothetical protein